MNLIMFIGDPFSGKSFLADKIKFFLDSEGIPAFIIKTVSARFNDKKDFKFTAQHVDESIASTKAEKDSSYKALLHLAKEILERGGIPILDATFHKKYRREWIYQFCKGQGISLLVVNTIFTDKDVIMKQISSRQSNQDYKDNILASFDAYELMVRQKDNLSDQEIRENDISVMQVNRDEKQVKLISFKGNDDFVLANVVSFLQKSI